MSTLETKLVHSKEDPVIEVIERVKEAYRQTKELIGLQTGLKCLCVFNLI